MYQSQIVLDNCCGTPFCAETALTVIALQILDLFLLVARSHTYVFIENFLFIQLHRHLNDRIVMYLYTMDLFPSLILRPVLLV